MMKPVAAWASSSTRAVPGRRMCLLRASEMLILSFVPWTRTPAMKLPPSRNCLTLSILVTSCTVLVPLFSSSRVFLSISWDLNRSLADTCFRSPLNTACEASPSEASTRAVTALTTCRRAVALPDWQSATSSRRLWAVTYSECSRSHRDTVSPLNLPAPTGTFMALRATAVWSSTSSTMSWGSGSSHRPVSASRTQRSLSCWYVTLSRVLGSKKNLLSSPVPVSAWLVCSSRRPSLQAAAWGRRTP
uniref:Uncharacterized protein n=1 Tax=Rousettus aegyptiacus TaxID=9407 RepID=A0A7J8C2T9_ROUAE|nr:hypothetical protein HJG63_009482 [Rousettus aegyptiacus]